MNLISVLAEGVAKDDIQNVVDQAYAEFIKIINIVLPVVMAVILALGLFYGIRLGVQYAQADDDEKKKKAKSALINVIVGFLIAILLVAVIEIILNQGFVKDLFGDSVIGNVAGDKTTTFFILNNF